MFMWVVYRDRDTFEDAQTMYWRGESNDWSSKSEHAACWADRRDAHRAAVNLQWANRELYADNFTTGTIVVDMPPANPSQIIPEPGEVAMKRAGRSR